LYTLSLCFFFFFTDTATTEIYTLSLHDALPISKTSVGSKRKTVLWISISGRSSVALNSTLGNGSGMRNSEFTWEETLFNLSSRPDRKSTRLNSSHVAISYAVFCLKKKKTYLELG